MKIDEALYQLKQNIKMHEIEGTTSNQNEREKALLDYITNLQARNEKAIEYIGNGNIGIPRKTRDKFIAILKGEDNTPKNLYKYTPEKGFRLVGDDNER